jgi:hypothetical protein
MAVTLQYQSQDGSIVRCALADGDRLGDLVGPGTFWVTEAAGNNEFHLLFPAAVVTVDPATGQAVVESRGNPAFPIAAYVAPEAPPASCTKLGLKRAFVGLGLWDRVRPLIYDGGEVQDDWELASVISRNDPLVKGVQAAMTFTDDQVTAIINAAAAAVA